MKKFLLMIFATLIFAGCGGSETAEKVSDAEKNSADKVETVAANFAEDTNKLVESNAAKFRQVEYTDAETGLSVTYNLFLPEGYEKNSYPLVVFIADASTVGKGAEYSLTQGRGAVVWAADEWQKIHPCIVAVPTYNETVLDDHDGYKTTEYIDLTKRLIEDVAKKYSADTSRIYGTGQSMGCMTTMLLAAKYPELYAAVMLVDGQWNIAELKGLETQKFVYIAAEDDDRAFAGLQEVEKMFDADKVAYNQAQWAGNWSADELSAAAEKLFANPADANFITWQSGTIQPKDNNRASYHMGAFDYAYNCAAVMEWIFKQNN